MAKWTEWVRERGERRREKWLAGRQTETDRKTKEESVERNKDKKMDRFTDTDTDEIKTDRQGFIL